MDLFEFTIIILIGCLAWIAVLALCLYLGGNRNFKREVARLIARRKKTDHPLNNLERSVIIALEQEHWDLRKVHPLMLQRFNQMYQKTYLKSKKRFI